MWLESVDVTIQTPPTVAQVAQTPTAAAALRPSARLRTVHRAPFTVAVTRARVSKASTSGNVATAAGILTQLRIKCYSDGVARARAFDVAKIAAIRVKSRLSAGPVRLDRPRIRAPQREPALEVQSLRPEIEVG